MASQTQKLHFTLFPLMAPSPHHSALIDSQQSLLEPNNLDSKSNFSNSDSHVSKLDCPKGVRTSTRSLLCYNHHWNNCLVRLNQTQIA
ncbi:hypothetical protein CsSME_00038208 [Camellia sinensis var. sinensis]